MRFPVQASIDSAALRHNCGVLRKAAGKRGLFAVIKAKAYGHGLLGVAATIAGQVDGLCVYDLTDAVSLRQAGHQLPVLVLGGFRNEDELTLLVKHGLWAVLHQHEQVAMLEAAAQLPVRVFVKAQTGMHRLGLALESVPEVIRRLKVAGCANLALMHHFADAGKPANATVQQHALQQLLMGCNLPFSASNSAATLLLPDAGEEFVRCGIAVYGGSPLEGKPAASWGLRPVMTLSSEVIACQHVAASSAVGYGLRWRAQQDSVLAVVACGYAHGYPRRVPDGAPVWIGGKGMSLAGRVSMEMLTVDTRGEKVRLGDSVELWGANVPVDAIAGLSGTIGYELLAGLPDQVPRLIDS